MKPGASSNGGRDGTPGKNTGEGAGISNGLAGLLAFAAGAGIANIYYCQPLLNQIAVAFGASMPAAGVVVVATQLGYASGLLLLVPLGDAFERRRLIVGSLLCAAVMLLAAGFSPSVHVLVVLCYLVGLVSIAPQMVVPYAVTFAAPEQRGRVVGVVMGGLFTGILSSRALSGFIGARLGWQWVFFIGSAAMVALAAVLRWRLPAQRPREPVAVRKLLVSLWPILKSQPVLRRHMVIGAVGFGAFSVFWTTLSFYLASLPGHYGSAVAGVFGLLGVTGALIAPVSGRLSDRFSARVVNGATLALIIVAFGVMLLAGRSLAWLVAGVILMDAGVQGSHVSNQSRIFALDAALRSRINALYMVAYFLGGAAGSAIGSRAFAHWGWPGVCAAGAALSAVGLAVLFSGKGGAQAR